MKKIGILIALLMLITTVVHSVASIETMSVKQMQATEGGRACRQCGPWAICSYFECQEKYFPDNYPEKVCGRGTPEAAEGCLLGAPWQDCENCPDNYDHCTLMEFCLDQQGDCNIALESYDCSCGLEYRVISPGCKGIHCE